MAPSQQASGHPIGRSCSSCGFEALPDDRYCGGCGARFFVYCRSCAAALRPGVRFCTGCGVAVDPVDAGGVAISPLVVAPQSPVPVAVASVGVAAVGAAGVNVAAVAVATVEPGDGAPENDAEAEEYGERRIATVAMSDLSGYTAMTERLDPELVETLMALVKARAHEIVSDHGGTLNQFVGDEIVALYGVPIAQGRDACAAVRATKRLHEMVDEISATQASTYGVDLTLHSGICSGLIVVNRRDARDGMYTITGDTINTAARLVAVANANEIVVAPKTRAAIADEFELVALEPVNLKGKAKPLVPFRVAGEIASSAQTARWRGSSTPFANRVTELRDLSNFAQRAKDGLAVASVSGEAGVGKSRLIFEFLRALPIADYAIARGYGQNVSRRTPYLPWSGALRSGFGISDGATPDEAADIVVERCSTTAALADHTTALLRFMNLPETNAIPLGDDVRGSDLQRRFWDAAIAFLRDMCSDRTGLVVLDDWQFADEASRTLLAEIGRELADERLAIVVCETGASTAPGGLHLELSDLELEPTIAMLAALFGVAHVAPELAEAVYERTDGNPLFVEETALSMIEDESIIVDDVARLAVPADRLTLPANVHAAMLQRLDRLPPAERECVRYAAVIGREFSSLVLARIVPGIDAMQTIRELCAASVFIALGESSNRYAFTHGIMQDVAYETLLRRTRKRIHASVGSALEDIYRDSLADHYEELAYHYGHSADGERATLYSERAGDKAADHYALADARRQYHDAYERLALEDPALRDERHVARIAIKLAAVSVFAPTAMHLEALETSLAAARASGDEATSAQLEYWIGRLEYTFGRYQSAIERFERVALVAEATQQSELFARATAVLGRTTLFTLEPERGEVLLGRAIGLLRSLHDPQEVAYSMSSLGCLKALTGDFTIAEEQFSRALRLARNHNNLSIESLVLQQLGWARALRGDWTNARDILARCAALAERTGNEVLHAFADVFHAYTLAYDGDVADAVARMSVGIARYARTGAKLAASMVFGWGAEVFARGGDFGRAREEAANAFARGDDGDRFGRLAAMRARMRIEAHERDVAAVRATFADAERTARESALHCDRALATFAFAESLRRLDEPDSGAHFAAARERFRDVDMPWFERLAAAQLQREEIVP